MKFRVIDGIMRGLLPGAGAALLVLVWATPVLAHTADSHIRTVIDDVAPAMPGVEVRVEAGVATQLVVENHGDRTVTVLGRDGTPFLRIGPDGVWGDRSTADFYATATPTGGLPRPPDAPDEPTWVQLAADPAWGWFDHRLHPGPLTTPRDLDPADAPIEFHDWQVPMQHGDRDVQVRGHLEFAFVPGSVVATLSSDTEPLPGVTVTVSQGRVPAILLDNATDEEVLVRGQQGEPFLRIGPDGVFGNENSPSFVDDQRYRDREVAEPPRADGPPAWVELAGEPRYAWLEERARYPREQPPQEVVTSDRSTVLREWSVPIEHGDDRVTLHGETRWMPDDEAFAALGIPASGDTGSDWAPVVSWLVFGLGVVLIVIGLRRRTRARRQADGAATG